MLQSEQDMAEVLAQGGTPAGHLHEIALGELRLIGENRMAEPEPAAAGGGDRQPGPVG